MQLSTSHFEKTRVEAFLRTLNEKLEQLPFNWKLLSESARIDDAVKLTNIDKSLFITVIFVKNYSDANLIAKADFNKDAMRWGQNGSIMYVVESPDPEMVSEVVSIFAGQE